MSDFIIYFNENLAAAKAPLWEQMIYQVVHLFQEAERRIRSPEGQARYGNLDGWWRKPGRVAGVNGVKVPEETAISEALIEQMEQVKQDFMLNSTGSPSGIGDIDSLEFHTEVPRRQKVGIGKKAKPTDFRFYRSGIAGFDLRIEAKVLVKDPEIDNSYLSSRGIGRFSDSKEPYTDELVGGMIAYTVSEDRGAWLEKIANKIPTSNSAIRTFRHAVKSSSEPTLFSLVPFKFPKRPQQSEVLVFHVVLEFDCLPTVRGL